MLQVSDLHLLPMIKFIDEYGYFVNPSVRYIPEFSSILRSALFPRRVFTNYTHSAQYPLMLQPSTGAYYTLGSGGSGVAQLSTYTQGNVGIVNSNNGTRCELLFFWFFFFLLYFFLLLCDVSLSFCMQRRSQK
jgi:hypothetical protein